MPPVPPVQKIILAVHGIGDQSRNETALATTIRFCEHFDYPDMIPLGAFYGALDGKPALFVPNDPPRDGLTGTIGFAEVYWADIARKIDEDKYTLQETKAWALSVVNRVRAMAAEKNAANTEIDYSRIRLVLEEMIDTIGVLESLLFLSRKAGLVDFDLKKILDAFLGDVQLVADFPPIRQDIVGKFLGVLAAVETHHPGAEIHIVSHSEGTVVAFLGLLEGCHNPAKHRWIHRVRGFMTLGSPIDKHLILWPAIFDKFTGPRFSWLARFRSRSTPPRSSLGIQIVKIPLGTTKKDASQWLDLLVPGLNNATEFLSPIAQPEGPAHPLPPAIRWVNYVDYSDPVGFELDTARDWLKQNGYARIFRFSPRMDYAFRRYPVPGKAHVDYWLDPEVFGHFIRTVVAPDRTLPLAAKKALIKNGPPPIWWVPLVSYGVAYLLPLAVIHLGVFILCKAISGYLDPKDTGDHASFLSCVLGLSWLVAGTTVWLRLVRLTRGWFWFGLGLILYVASAAAFTLLIGNIGRSPELEWIEAPALRLGWPLGLATLETSLLLIAIVLVIKLRFWRRRTP